MNDLDELIRATYELQPLDTAERVRIWKSAMSRTPESKPRARRRMTRRARAVVLASLVLVCVTSVALAAGTNVIQRVFGDDTPAIDRVDQFAKPVLEPVTRAEYDMAEGMTWVPSVNRLGNIRDSKMVQQFQLAPRDDARVLVDDPKFGRVVAVPTVDGNAICTVVSRPAATDASGASSSCDRFDKSGLMPGYMFTGDPASVDMAYFGIASDDVTAITFTFRDGSTEDIPLVRNVFRWEGQGKASAPVRITTTRGGIVEEAVNGFARQWDPRAN